MEQLGDNFQPFYKFLTAQSFSICVHIEPFSEFRQDEDLLDYLAEAYTHKRNYLRGYLRHLERYEEKGALEIIAKRKLLGSTFFDGWCLVAWRPLSKFAY